MLSFGAYYWVFPSGVGCGKEQGSCVVRMSEDVSLDELTLARSPR